MPRSHAFVNVALTAITCLKTDPALVGTDDGSRVEALATEATELASSSEDDHYWLYEGLYAVRLGAHDPAGAHAVAARYLAYVERAAPPRSDDERMARDLARLRAATKLGEPARAIPALEASEAALPHDDNASARLCAAYTAAARFADAIASCTRGLSRAPGPSGTVRLLVGLARAELGAGDAMAARRDLDRARGVAATITVASERKNAEAMIQAQLDALARSAPAGSSPPR
jgi:hypothetical protein